MATTTLPQKPAGKMRPLNIMRDLPKVAGLVELCFKKKLGSEGKSYLAQMRSASNSLNSVPLKGYVWENQKNIIGNISIIPFRKAKKNVILLANIAVHPDYRRKGIARALTQKGIKIAEKQKAKSIWLHVDSENIGAINLYKELGFRPHSYRTTWHVGKELPPLKKNPYIHISSRKAHFWEAQNSWLGESYPEVIRWYRTPNFDIFKPGLMQWLHRLFVEYDIKQWAVQRDGELQALLMWKETHTRRAPIWLATAPQADSESLTTLLLYARYQLASPKRVLNLNFLAGKYTSAFEQAGFSPQRTLLWMVK